LEKTEENKGSKGLKGIGEGRKLDMLRVLAICLLALSIERGGVNVGASERENLDAMLNRFEGMQPKFRQRLLKRKNRGSIVGGEKGKKG